MAIYNDFRPRKFDQILGQDTITQILKSQAVTGHYHHSYMFFGASGSGKTSTARLLASVLNCDSPQAGEPCGSCNNCRLVQSGDHWDTIELDAARFRGIDDIKDLCFKASYSPMGKHKIYILDECHMLTEPAWACLLKLLEEPPPYLVLILCTTEFAKIPETITSRCQLYPFKKLDDSLIKCKLQSICKGMGITPDERSLNNICQTSFGNMRRAENTLEQLCCQLTGAK
jgi:DNA polymerase-3 subunit gamma/tau